MKTLLVAGCLFMATTSFALDDYCKDRHSTRDRLKTTVNWSAYKQCVEEETRRQLENELLRSEIELNKAKVKWLRDDNRRRYYQQFPQEVEK